MPRLLLSDEHCSKLQKTPSGKNRERQRESGYRDLPQSAPCGKRLRPAEALPGTSISTRQDQEKLRKCGGYDLSVRNQPKPT